MADQKKFEKDFNMAKTIAKEVNEAGGRVFFVGGFVRDRFLRKDNKDIDIEVHDIEPEKLKEILIKLGHLDERKVGDNFGVMALRGYDIDIAMPRSEKKIGEGHKGFIIDVDPFIGYETAAKRRDFTINAMMEDVLTGEILDFYGGIEDIKNKLIRHVDNITFKDDPLRVLRAAQFAARFDFTIAPETIEICKNMNLKELPRERVVRELDKVLLKAAKPSVFFNELRKMGQLDYWFLEVKDLINVPQEPSHHPEGDVYTHTMMVLDKAAEKKAEVSNYKYFMMAALCHDFGKKLTTEYNSEKQKIQAIEHEKAGVELARNFVKKIYNEKDMIKYVTNMVEMHMKPNSLINNNSSNRSYMEMFDKSVKPDDLILLAECDYMGRAIENRDFDERRNILKEKMEMFHEIMSRPHVTGQDLINMGYVPSPEFTEMLNFAHKSRVAGIDKKTVLAYISGMYRNTYSKAYKYIKEFNKNKKDVVITSIVISKEFDKPMLNIAGHDNKTFVNVDMQGLRSYETTCQNELLNDYIKNHLNKIIELTKNNKGEIEQKEYNGNIADYIKQLKPDEIKSNFLKLYDFMPQEDYNEISAYIYEKSQISESIEH